ncbi:unnamed protein product [Brachionus calyciflorus]|uniref:Alpha-1,3-glucosyltransferase n=1 Tax=Brachionus calyciflorus TaxID=104777 RepID=A0A813TNA6_9BILA|nr:unnamed protein product [Brachionus calyciflorus]
MTVLLFDLIIFYPSVYLILNEIISSTKTKDSILMNTNQKDYLISLLLILLNPNLVLIDHGHFQYNSISLGLMQLAILFILYYTHDNNNNNNSSKRNLLHLVLSSLFFTMALNYKQMELYHALPIFFYLLGLCFKSNIFKNGFVKLVFIGSTVILTFLILWLPFILNGLDSVAQVVTRIFPIKRGLFEDKVANFWCSISPFIKLKENFSLDTLTKLSFLATLLFNLPCCLNLLLRPSRQRFMIAIVNSALVFYLFSFQVHEKSIIIATVPACLLINFYPFIITWFILIANLSMLPLLIKDGLVMGYISTSLIFLLISTIYYKNRQTKESLNYWPNLKSFNNLIKFVYFLSLLGLLILTLCALFLKPPKKLPDLWTVLICIYSCGHFIIFSIVFNLIQFTLKSEDLLLASTSGRLFNFDCSLFTYNNNNTLSDAKKKLN